MTNSIKGVMINILPMSGYFGKKYIKIVSNY